MAYGFAVKWVCSRGFANKGNYVYGSTQALKADEIISIVRNSQDGRIVTISHHHTLSAAKAAAEKLLRKDRGRAGRWGEESYETVRKADSEF